MRLKRKPILIAGNRYLVTLLGVPRYFRFILTGVFFLTVCLGWFILLHQPINRKIMLCQKRIAHIRTTISSLEKTLEQGPQIEHELSVARANLQSCDTATLGDDTSHAIVALAKGVAINGVQVKPIGVQSSQFYDTESYEIELQSTFSKLLAFLTRLEQAHKGIAIKKCQWTRGKRKRVILQVMVQVIKNVHA